jgi:hypothetical protein
MRLALRPTIIAGQRVENDYLAIRDGRRIGRIRLAQQRSGGALWESQHGVMMVPHGVVLVT